MTDEEGAARLWAWDVGSTPDRFSKYSGVSYAKWVAMFRLARELLGAPALPAEPAPGFVRVRIPMNRGARDELFVGVGIAPGGAIIADFPKAEVYCFITADVPLPPAPAEIVGSVE